MILRESLPMADSLVESIPRNVARVARVSTSSSKISSPKLLLHARTSTITIKTASGENANLSEAQKCKKKKNGKRKLSLSLPGPPSKVRKVEHNQSPNRKTNSISYRSLDEEEETEVETIDFFQKITKVSTDLVLIGRDFRIPCHIFPIASESKSLEGLICQPSNEEESSHRLDEKVSKEVALDFTKRCYIGYRNVSPNLADIKSFEDFVQYGTLVDMHLSLERKQEFKTELQDYIIKTVDETVEKSKNQSSKRELANEICYLFLVAHRFNLDLEKKNIRWMFFIHGLIEPGKHFKYLTPGHLRFLSTKRRKKDYRVGSSFFQFVFLMCFFKNWELEELDLDWHKPRVEDAARFAKFIERKSVYKSDIREKLVNMFGRTMFPIFLKATREAT